VIHERAEQRCTASTQVDAGVANRTLHRSPCFDKALFQPVSGLLQAVKEVFPSSLKISQGQ